VFVPRPETEVMTGWALEELRTIGGSPVVVELCTGSGAIAKSLASELATELPGLDLHAVELSAEAHAYAERNLAGTGVDLRLDDMADAFAELDGSVDLVIANPPYIPLEAWESVPAEVRDFDPQIALFSGDDGLDALRVVARVAARLLRTDGLLCAEHAEVQHESAQQVLVEAGAFREIRDHVDLTQRYRFVTGTRRHSGDR
jgi:release factor glutamine methyltransferase